MARKNKTPLYQKENQLDLSKDVLGGDLLQSDAVRDQMHSADITKAGSGVQQLDMSGLDEYISKVEKPASGSVFDKQAAYYRQKGEGDVLRMQKDLANLFIPTIALWQEREEAANAKFEMLKKQMPEFDDSKIFGEGGPNKIPMPVVDEIKNISTSVKADLRELSRMNINDPRYDELRKKAEKDQAVIKQFHDINQKLLAIRNDVGTDENGSQIKLGNNIQGDWSATMSDNERAMWIDIYNSNGENIKVIDGKLMWVPEDKISYEFKGGTVGELHTDDKWKALGGDNTTLGALAGATRDIYTGKQNTGEELADEFDDDILYIQRLLKKLYPDHDFGGTGENEDGMDGKWGNKTQAAYDKYLNEKDKLETEWLNENLSEEDKEKYQVITPGKNIDLATIGDGPRMKDGIAFKTHLASIDRLGRGLQGGATPKGNQFQINTYKALRLTIEEDFKRLGVEGQASLLFDGVGRIGEDDALRVDGFLHNIMTNNSDKFPGYKSLNEEERIEAWDKIREGGMLETYTLNGKTATLQTHFKDFYMGEIDKRAMSYVPPRKNRGRSNTGNKTNISTLMKQKGNVWNNLYNQFKNKTAKWEYITSDGKSLGTYEMQSDGSWINKELDKNDDHYKKYGDEILSNMEENLTAAYKTDINLKNVPEFQEFMVGNKDFEKRAKESGYHKLEDGSKLLFNIQVGVWEGGDLNEKTKELIDNLNSLPSYYGVKVKKVHDRGILYKYIAKSGRYNDAKGLVGMERALARIKEDFPSAFIYAEKDGERISEEEALELIK